MGKSLTADFIFFSKKEVGEREKQSAAQSLNFMVANLFLTLSSSTPSKTENLKLL